MANIAIRGLTKRFGPVTAVDRLDADVREGAVTGLLGPNAAGKTTTLRMLLGLIRPDAGAATIGGVRYHRMERPSLTVGAALDGAQPHPGRTGRAHLRILAAAAGLPRTRADDVLDTVGLTAAAGRRAGTYSLGQRQRLALAAALLGDPPVLILDEPANGLDPAGIRWLRDLLRARAAEGHTVLVSSHQLSELARTADEVIIMAAGTVRGQLPTADLTAHKLEVLYLRMTGEHDV
ncbi:ATP-binding cassette domain-containing protein [Dactylosporangium vinaceum]|uniref:ABC transporter ATP-binding protein n=1 Tax=Dactylosporangium vinaceum TaxID=53362 RepID=A0ABV5MMV4_9ACTN|nr:ATP-binding cassette domain-containing protein [Dactylosporangium vinaceum]